MKQLLILSGKGGTGKTTLASGFIRLSKARHYADCDVDAPNLHLVMNNKSLPVMTNFYGLPKASIQQEECIHCGICKENCRFEAIKSRFDETLKREEYWVDSHACEGCGVCEYLCPAEAISMVPEVAGHLMLYKNYYTFSTARLVMGSGNSGKLVTEVKKQLGTNEDDTELSIIDGSPGIGCPVIASITGADMILIVAEPTVSGISDMERIIETSRIFQTKLVVCVNKHDINQENTEKIRDFCEINDIPYVGEIPYDQKVIEATNAGKTAVDISCEAGVAIERIFYKVLKLIFQADKPTHMKENPAHGTEYGTLVESEGTL